MPLALLKQGHDKPKIVGLLVLEALVIFAGITSSFWIEEWRQQREDLETYRHLLEEIYYNTVIDEAGLPINIAGNNLALKDALHLTLETGELPDAELYDRLDHIFGGVGASFSNAGYVRLSNTSLSIPFDETMLTLDNAYESFVGLEGGLEALDDEIDELRTQHWRSAGMISCTGAASNDGTTILMDRPYMAEIRTLMYPDGDCITRADNEAAARALLRRPAFRNALRQVIDIRQDAAWLMGIHWSLLEGLQAAIEARLPDVGLPIASMELVSWPLTATEQTERRAPMRQMAPHIWEVTVDLSDGFIKFRANDDWSINWGAPFPYMIDAPGFLWNSDRVKVEDVFPTGVAHFNGMNLPVRGGAYRVTFNSRTGNYSFEAVRGP
jgi:hypothetical protein